MDFSHLIKTSRMLEDHARPTTGVSTKELFASHPFQQGPVIRVAQDPVWIANKAEGTEISKSQYVVKSPKNIQNKLIRQNRTSNADELFPELKSLLADEQDDLQNIDVLHEPEKHRHPFQSRSLLDSTRVVKRWELERQPTDKLLSTRANIAQKAGGQAQTSVLREAEECLRVEEGHRFFVYVFADAEDG